MGFRNNHPVLLGLLILAGIFLLFWGGVSLLFTAAVSRGDSTEIFSKKNGIGVVELKGLIVSPEETIETLTAFRKKENVKAIVLRIDSPGGAVGASQEIFTEVQRTNEVKPVIASLGSIGASGGYYAALGAEEIIASPGTLTGSVGVIIKFSNFKELFDKIGYKSEVIKSGLMKDIGAPDRAMTEAERELVQKLIDNVHAQFIQAVAQQRRLPEERVRELADGRVFSGEQALENGLIDRLGNYTDAVRLAASLSGLDEEEPHLIYQEEKRYSLFRLLTGEARQRLLKNLLPIVPAILYQWTGIKEY
jgi:protease-4